MKVLGIDPGSHRTGWGVVVALGNQVQHVASGLIDAGSGPTATRLVAIAEALEAVLAEHRPDAVSVEMVFHAKNSQSALVLGQARGAAIVSAARSGAPVFEYTAGQIKQATTGRGRADKEQVQQMVRLILNLTAAMPLDTSDALAAAICHTQMYATPSALFLRQAERAARHSGR
jgi:crossover junction endodeoxyribonuclease RuvC